MFLFLMHYVLNHINTNDIVKGEYEDENVDQKH
jgi:hypothetical protein